MADIETSARFDFDTGDAEANVQRLAAVQTAVGREIVRSVESTFGPFKRLKDTIGAVADTIQILGDLTTGAFRAFDAFRDKVARLSNEFEGAAERGNQFARQVVELDTVTQRFTDSVEDVVLGAIETTGVFGDLTEIGAELSHQISTGTGAFGRLVRDGLIVFLDSAEFVIQAGLRIAQAFAFVTSTVEKTSLALAALLPENRRALNDFEELQQQIGAIDIQMSNIRLGLSGVDPGASVDPVSRIQIAAFQQLGNQEFLEAELVRLQGEREQALAAMGEAGQAARDLAEGFERDADDIDSSFEQTFDALGEVASGLSDGADALREQFRSGEFDFSGLRDQEGRGRGRGGGDRDALRVFAREEGAVDLLIAKLLAAQGINPNLGDPKGDREFTEEELLKGGTKEIENAGKAAIESGDQMQGMVSDLSDSWSENIARMALDAESAIDFIGDTYEIMTERAADAISELIGGVGGELGGGILGGLFGFVGNLLFGDDSRRPRTPDAITTSSRLEIEREEGRTLVIPVHFHGPILSGSRDNENFVTDNLIRAAKRGALRGTGIGQ
jgi:hypothetical protein